MICTQVHCFYRLKFRPICPPVATNHKSCSILSVAVQGVEVWKMCTVFTSSDKNGVSCLIRWKVSLMCIRKSRRPRKRPWMTPLGIGQGVKSVLFVRTICLRVVRYEENQRSPCFWIPFPFVTSWTGHSYPSSSHYFPRGTLLMCFRERS